MGTCEFLTLNFKISRKTKIKRTFGVSRQRAAGTPYRGRRAVDRQAPSKKLVQNTSFAEQARAPYKLRRETSCTWISREPPEENQRMVLLNGALPNANGVREAYMLQVAVTGSPGQR